MSRGSERNDKPYASFSREDLILRDFLANDRTLLANERTLLAYIRTALAIMVTGVSLMHFFDWALMWEVGLGLIPVGLIILGLGIHRYLRIRSHIRQIERTDRQQRQ